MRLLSRAAAETFPAFDPKIITNAGFTRFLEIAADVAALEVVVKLTVEDPGVVRASLLSRSRLKAMTRVVSHCDPSFTAAPSLPTAVAFLPDPPSAIAALEIPAERICRELVPFGPAYRTLRSRLRLTAAVACGKRSRHCGCGM